MLYGLRRNTFALAGKAEAFGSGCFHAHLFNAQPRNLGDPVRMGGPTRPHPRCFSDDRAIDMVDRRIAAAEQFDRMGKKQG